MSIALRHYQLDALERVRDAYRRGVRSVLYVGPPGMGKTTIFAAVCRGAAERGNKVLILCHRAELIAQISTALTEQGVPHGFIAAAHDHRRGHAVYIASVFTLVRRTDVFSPDLIIIDEAHHTAQTTTWGRVLSTYPNARRLGVSGSPLRLSGEGLSDHFEELIEGPDYDELQALGYLCPCKVYAPPTISTEGLHTRLGDYIHGEVESRVNRPSVTGDAIEHYKRLTPGKRAIVFDVSVEAARSRAAAFRQQGFTADCIDGTLDSQVRARLVADFRAGRLQVLTSCDLVSEGFDLPAIEVGISLRPTQSLGLYLQQTGRILRPFAGKSVAYLFDHAGNVHRFGLPTQTRTWSLAGACEARGSRVAVPGVRICAACFAAAPARALVCPQCGTRFEIRPRSVVEKDGDLEEVTASADELAARRKKSEQGQAKTLAQLIELGRMRGMRRPDLWAAHVMSTRKSKGRV